MKINSNQISIGRSFAFSFFTGTSMKIHSYNICHFLNFYVFTSTTVFYDIETKYSPYFPNTVRWAEGPAMIRQRDLE